MTATFELASSGGNGFSFGPQGAQPGATITGTVLDMKEVQRTNYETKQLEFWDNGDPKMQFRVTLQTQLRDHEIVNDDGKRELYLDGRKKPNDNGTKSRICAVLDAVRAATGGTALAAGGELTVTWVSGMGFSGDPRNYEATYRAPAMDLGGGQPQQAAPQQAAPQQAYTPPPAQQPVQQYAQPQQGYQQQPPAQQQYVPPAQPQQQAYTPPPAQQPAAQAPAQQQAPGGPTPEQIAGLLANRTDPRMVFPGVQLTPEQAAQVAAFTQPQG